jgi:hypothetical protein
MDNFLFNKISCVMGVLREFKMSLAFSWTVKDFRWSALNEIR